MQQHKQVGEKKHLKLTGTIKFLFMYNYWGDIRQDY